MNYSKLIEFPTFEERLEYLRLDALPGEMTFGALREINQQFYRSQLWKNIREAVIGRDLGYDLGIPGFDILGKAIVHHINPITPKDIYTVSYALTDLDNLILVSHDTHQAIHFGAKRREVIVVDRRPGDTIPWRPYGDNSHRC